ncbi:MAG TPA: OmpW family outer membrane protein [Candidatus Binatia bacterium]|nr:OmpW family outer membrane protein [Candidatus Binatia bacterium]
MTSRRHRDKGYRAIVFAVSACIVAFASLAYPIETNRKTNVPSESGRMALGILAGYGLFSNSNFGNSVAFGATFTYGFSKNVAVELAGLFLSAKNKNDPAGLSQGRLTMLPLQLSLLGRLPLGRKLTPYALAGVTYFLNGFASDQALEDDWHDLGFTLTEKVNGAVGFHVGAGLEYDLGKKLAAGIGVRYCLGKTRGEWSLKDDASAVESSGTFSGLDLNTMVISAGLKFFLK